MSWTPTTRDCLAMFTIYDHPLDHPDGFVVRRWTIEGGAAIPCEARVAGSLREARALLPDGLVNLKRYEADDPKIVETWI